MPFISLLVVTQNRV